jgi:hypothetical protein
LNRFIAFPTKKAKININPREMVGEKLGLEKGAKDELFKKSMIKKTTTNTIIFIFPYQA